MSNPSYSKSRVALISLILAAITFFLYLPVKDARFLIYDDNMYVAENTNVTSGLSLQGVSWAFTTGHAGNYHPLTWIAHQLDCQLFGLDSGKHHLMNVSVHCLNVVLLFLLMLMLTGEFWPSALISAMFAWHPMHVESVAWIAERKDTLCTLFWILTVMAYCSYTRNRSKTKYAGVMVLFTLALLAKPMAVTLPFLLLLLDYWPLNRMRLGVQNLNPAGNQYLLRQLFIEKIPLIILSVVESVVTYFVQKDFGSMASINPPLDARLSNAAVSYFRYVYKLVWPHDFAILYPYVDSLPLKLVVLSSVVLLVVWSLVLRCITTRKYCFVGWSWFLGVLVPTIGLVQVGEQSMADRYSYIPAVGLFIMAVWLLADFISRRPAFRIPAIILAVAVLGVYLYQSRCQVAYWRDSQILFEHELKAAGASANGEYNLAFIYQDMGRHADAVLHYQKSLELDPTQFVAHHNLGVSLAKLGRHSEATNHFQKALDKAPNLHNAHISYGASLMVLGDKEGARSHYEQAVSLRPDLAATHFSLGSFYLSQGEYGLAKGELELANSIDPSQPDIHRNLASIFSQTGEHAKAIEEYETVLKLNPDDIATLNDFAWLRAANADPTLRNGPEAVKLAKRACELTQSTQPYLLGTLADAYAEAGQFDEAVATAQKAIAKAIEGKLPQVAERNKELLELYKSHQAFHESPPSTTPPAAK